MVLCIEASFNNLAPPVILLIAMNILHIFAVDYIDHASSGIDYNTELTTSDIIYSSNGLTRFKLGNQGQAILQTYVASAWTTQWGNGVKPVSNAILAIQWDGNLVVYSSGNPVWGAGSNNAYPPQHLVVNNDGYAYMLNSQNQVKWSTSGITSGLPTFAAPTAAVTPQPTISPTDTPTNTPCNGNFYTGPFDISEFHQIGTVIIGDILEISFNFKVNSSTWTCTTGWCNILRIGPSAAGGVKLPLIRIYSVDQRLQVSHTGLNNFNEYGVSNMFDGNTHSFYFKHTPTRNIFVFDGITYLNATAPYDNTEFGKTHDIWLCDDSNSHPVEGVVFNLCVHSTTTTTTTTISPSSNAPTKLPTTNSPTTNHPTTNHPTTNIPTYYPTTNAPTTTQPTTNIPITDAPTTNLPTQVNVSPSQTPTEAPTQYKADDGEQSVEESKTTSIISTKMTASELESENVSFVQTVVLMVSLAIIIIMIVFCLACGICLIVKKLNVNGNINKDKATDVHVEMNRVMSFSQSPSSISAHTGAGMTPVPQSEGLNSNNTNVVMNRMDTGINTQDLPDLPGENEANFDICDTKPDIDVITPRTPQYPAGDIFDGNDDDDEDEDAIYEKPQNINTNYQTLI